MIVVPPPLATMTDPRDPPRPLLSKHMPQLDVLRGLAIALVLFYHGFSWTQERQPERWADLFSRTTTFGWLGVNLFFILSGFLITGILVDTKDRPDYFSNFYIRRVLRILPAYWLTIVVLVLAGMLSKGGVLTSLTFLANYTVIPAAKTYSPFWSLSVEEQFYLFWPVIVLLLSRRSLAWFAALLCVAEPVLRAVVEYATGSDVLPHAATFLIADNLALGALAALLVRSRWGTRRNALGAAALLSATAVALLIFGLPQGLLHRNHPLGAALQTEPFNLLFTAALLAMLALGGKAFAGRAFQPLRWLGDVSYGLYLVHLIVFAEFDGWVRPPGSYYGHFGALVGRFVICATVAMGLAWLSRRFYEEPFLRMKGKLAPRTPGVGVREPAAQGFTKA